jgi:hypothetical protein
VIRADVTSHCTLYSGLCSPNWIRDELPPLRCLRLGVPALA